MKVFGEMIQGSMGLAHRLIQWELSKCRRS